jgi:lipopolysaccharide assembly protein A
MADKEKEKETLQDKKFTTHHVKLIILMIIAVLLVVFAIQNAQVVIIRLLFWDFAASMALALLICLISGLLLSFIYFLPLLREKDKIIKGKEKEIARLRLDQQRRPPDQKKYPDYL